MNRSPEAIVPQKKNRKAEDKQSQLTMGISAGNTHLYPTSMTVRALKVQNYNNQGKIIMHLEKRQRKIKSGEKSKQYHLKRN